MDGGLPRTERAEGTHALLRALGGELTQESLEAAGDPAAQLALVRATFLKAALASHPDKTGGSDESFRACHAAYTQLKSLSRGGTVALAAAIKADLGGPQATPFAAFPSAYYEACAGGETPYCVEVAPSGRSKCVGCKTHIAQGDVRFGAMHPATGSYGWLSHVACTRIPSMVHAYLPDDLTDLEGVADALRGMDGLSLAGVGELSAAHLAQLVAAVSDKSRWAKTSGKKRVAIDADKAAKKAKKAKASEASEAGDSAATTTTTALAPKPLPAAAAAPPEIKAGALVGKTVVLTGVFNVSGGVGMARGKGGVEQWIKGAGGKAVGSISRNTSYLIVGTLPGASKLSKAQALGVPLLSLEALKALLRGEPSSNVEEADLSNVKFSAGFGGNGLAHRLTGPKGVPKMLKALAAPSSAEDDALVAGAIVA